MPRPVIDLEPYRDLIIDLYQIKTSAPDIADLLQSEHNITVKAKSIPIGTCTCNTNQMIFPYKNLRPLIFVSSIKSLRPNYRYIHTTCRRLTLVHEYSAVCASVCCDH